MRVAQTHTRRDTLLRAWYLWKGTAVTCDTKVEPVARTDPGRVRLASALATYRSACAGDKSPARTQFKASEYYYVFPVGSKRRSSSLTPTAFLAKLKCGSKVKRVRRYVAQCCFRPRHVTAHRAAKWSKNFRSVSTSLVANPCISGYKVLRHCTTSFIGFR